MTAPNNNDHLGSPARLWDGRMSTGASEIFSAYVDSISFDIVLAPYDVLISRAHAKMLEKQGIIGEDTLSEIMAGFDVIDHEIRTGDFQATLIPTDEDVHTAIERRLTQLAGDSGRALHTGRSRNDLAQMSGRLFVRDALNRISGQCQKLQSTLCDLAEKNIDLVMPGKTHLQHAQPILVSHWLMSHVARLENSCGRIKELMPRVNVCVLGSGALAGSTLDLDVEFIANELGCESISPNSVFAVSTRDYIAESLFVCAQIMVDLSCIGEDVVWMTSTECNYAILADEFSSGSSMMPQKKNPDIAELVRGKAGLTIGALTGLLSATKSQIFGYNHDLQVDKEALFPTMKDTELSLLAMEAMLATMTFNSEAFDKSLKDQPLLLATDITEAMVNNGTPFRIAYKAVAVCIRRALDLQLDGPELVSYLCADDLIGKAAREVYGDSENGILEAMRKSVDRRRTYGATATDLVKQAIADARSKIVLEEED